VTGESTSFCCTLSGLNVVSTFGLQVPHFLWSSVYGSIFGEGPTQDAFATALWILDQRRIKKEGLVDTIALPIKSTCFGNNIKDDIYEVEDRLNKAYEVRCTWGAESAWAQWAHTGGGSALAFKPPPMRPVEKKHTQLIDSAIRSP
jgi:hypothetical protein